MPFRFSPSRVLLVLAALLAAAPVHAAEFTDSAGRRFTLSPAIERIMPAGPASAVFVYVLSPQKLIGWPLPLTRAQRALLPAKFARLPVIGQLGGQFPTASAATVMGLHPDLIIGYGKITPATVALANRIQQQTHVPYILLDDSIQVMPQVLRDLNLALGGSDHGRQTASYAFHAIGELRGRLLISSPTDRPTVYYGRGPDGLETALPGSASASAIEQAGVINVAGALGRAGIVRVSRDQIFAWNPQIIIAEQRSFYDALRRSPRWRGLAAVRARKVYLAPADPFGWIDDPPGVNRTIGLYWLSALFYPNLYQQDLRTVVQQFYQLFYGVQLTGRQIEAMVGPAGGGQSQQLANIPILGAEPAPMPNVPSGAPMGAPPTEIPGRNGPLGGSGTPSTGSPYGPP